MSDPTMPDDEPDPIARIEQVASDLAEALKQIRVLTRANAVQAIALRTFASEKVEMGHQARLNFVAKVHRAAAGTDLEAEVLKMLNIAI